MRTLKRLKRRITPLHNAAFCAVIVVIALLDGEGFFSVCAVVLGCLAIALSLLSWQFGRRYHPGTYRLALRTHVRLQDLLGDVDNDTILINSGAGVQFIVEKKYGVTHVTRMRSEEIDPHSGVALIEHFTLSSNPIVYRSVIGGTLTHDTFGAPTITLPPAETSTGFWKSFLFATRTGTGIATTDEMTELLDQLNQAEPVGEHGE